MSDLEHYQELLKELDAQMKLHVQDFFAQKLNHPKYHKQVDFPVPDTAQTLACLTSTEYVCHEILNLNCQCVRRRALQVYFSSHRGVKSL